MDPFSICLVLVVAVFLLYKSYERRRKTLPFPPGPPPDPFIGNLRQFPKASAWRTHAEWSKQYNSDVISFTGFGKRMVVLNSVRAAVDLLDKRGTIYSERDHNVMVQELIGMDSIIFMPYDHLFRLHRKVMNTALNRTIVRNYYPIQEKEAYTLTDRILETPNQWRSHLRRAANSTILTMTYGHEVTTDDDYLVTLSEDTNNLIRQAVQPTAFLVNLLPSLKHIPNWVPGSHFKRFAEDGRKLRTELGERPFREVKDKIASGVVSPSYTARLLEMKGTITGDPEVDEEGLIKDTAMVMYAAGSESTASAVTNLILALVLHPEVQEKVHTELDTIIGNNRLPTFADQDSLPYLQMVLAESLRWNPVTSTGVPHAVQRDDVYNGMFIPKGSVVIANIWALMHDENMYPEPQKFWPERFDGRFPNVTHPRNIAFGFNRRICPGRHLALNSLFMQAASLLTVFSFSKARDEGGNEIEPLIDYSEGPPKPFKCSVTPRSDAAVALIRFAAASISS